MLRAAPLFALFLAVGLGPAAAAQAGPSTGQPPAPIPSSPTTTTVTDNTPPPALGAFGVSAGFPSFQTVAPYFSAQMQYVGFQVKASYTNVGPYVGLELRGYPPVPVPVPLFVGLGGGYYGGNATYFATLGAHVPLSLHVRLDVEAGAANVPLLDKRAWAPYLSLGVSYTFVFVPTYGGYGPEAAAPFVVGGSSAVTCETSTSPDKGRLIDAFHRTLKGFLDSARATYGSVYQGLSYSYSITSTTVSGNTGTVTIHYSGSVTTIATGRKVSAAGSASARYRWNGCGWSNVSVHY